MNKRPLRSAAASVERPSKSTNPLLELRSAFEFGASIATLPWLREAPQGDGHPVLLLPGFGTGDGVLEPLRLFLQHRNFKAETWGLGRNRGFDRRFSELVEQKIRYMHHVHKQRVSLVGYSLGGVFAFYAAHVAPECVRNTVTLGSPLRFDPDKQPSPGLRIMYRALGQPHAASTHHARARSRAMQGTPPGPSSCLYSESDALVPPTQSTIDGDPSRHENIRVPGSHLGLPVNGRVLWIVADRLSQREGAWQPFDISGLPWWLRRGVGASHAHVVHGVSR